MIKLEKKTVKKAGLASLLAGSMLALGTVISPQVEKYKILRDNLSSMSVVDRQDAVYQEMSNFRAKDFYGKIQNMGKRIALDNYQPRRKNFQ